MWALAYVIYRIRPLLSIDEFNYIFWVIMMITAISIAIRSTAHASKEERLFIYTLVSPTVALSGLIIFNALYLLLISVAF